MAPEEEKGLICTKLRVEKELNEITSNHYEEISKNHEENKIDAAILRKRLGLSLRNTQAW